MSSFNITGIYDQTYVIDSNVFSDISILQTGLSSLNTTVFENYTEFNEYRTTTNNNFSLFNNDLDNLTNLSNSNFSMLETKIDNLKITTLNKFELVATGLSVLEEDFTSYQTTTNQLIVDNLQESKDYTDQEVDELRTEGYIQEAVTQVLAWATSDEGKRFRKKIWDRLKLKWLSFTGNRPYTELIDDVEQEMTNELDEMLKVYRYQDDGLTGQIAGIRTDPYSNKEICMKGDTYIFSGNLYLTGDIYKGTFNQTTGLWTSIDKLNDFLVIKGFHDKTLEFIHINPYDQKLEIKYDNNSFETTGELSIKLAVDSNLKISAAGLAVDPDYTKTIKEYKDDAETAKDQAVTAKNQAVTAKNQAETAETQAQLHKTAAQTSATAAETAETQAQLHKTAAQTSATAAETAETQTQLHKTAAQTAQTAAQSSQTAAAASATTAQTSQTAAAASATAAEASATAAGASQTAAAASATAAEASVAAVTASATAAEASATASAGSATAAATSATAAGASATAAAGSAGAAAGSAGLAAGSAAAAALSALSFRKGDKGDQGDPGPMGPMGPMGPAGSPLSITWASPLKYNVTSNTVLYDYVDAALVYDSVYPVVRFIHPFDTSLQILANRNSTSRVYFTPGGPSFDYDNLSNNNISLSDFMTINGQTRIIGHLKSSSFQSNGEATILNTLNISGNTTINNSLNVVGNITTSGISIFSLNTTTTTIFNNLNSFSNSAQLSINNISSNTTTITTNLNSFSNSAQLSINNISSTSSTISTNLNNLSTNAQLSINNISSNTSTISTNLNNFSTNAQLSINNLNATSTTIFNKTNFNNLLVTGATTFYNTLNISGATTLSSSLNVVGNITTSGISIFNLNSTTTTILNNLNSFSTSAQLSINNLSSSSGVLTNLNNFSTSAQLSINNLNTTSTTIFNSLSGKQNTLTFSNPFNLSTNNNLSLKLDATLTTDASGNLKVVSGGSSQWTTTGTSIFYNTGNVGIGTNGPSYKLHVEDGSVFIGDSSYDGGNTGLGTANGYKIIFDNTYNGTAGAGNICNKIRLHNTSSFNAGFGIETGALVYQSGVTHRFYTGTTSTAYGFLSADISRDSFNFYGNVDGGSGGFIHNASSGSSAHTYFALKNATGTFAGLFLNSSARTEDGGANTLTLRNDVGNLRLSAKSDTPTIILEESTDRIYMNGAVNIRESDGSGGYAVPNNFMQQGSLTIGSIDLNYGGGNNFTANTAGLMFECLDNTEIAAHDANNRVASLIYFVGGANNYHEYGRNMGWGYPNAHYFRCNNLFECYFHNAAGGWQHFKVEPTSLWGDGLSSASEFGGTKYATIRNIMLTNPHITPHTAGNKAWVRLGRAGGVQSGTYWDTAVDTNGDFQIIRENNTFIGIIIDSSGNVGIANNDPIPVANTTNLCIGKCGAGYNTTGCLVLAQDYNNGSVRQMKMGMTTLWEWGIGDYGSTNANNSWTHHIRVLYNAPGACIYVGSSGYVVLSYGYGTSDERIKTNIQPVENALWKVQQLRGVTYTDIREQTNHIGLIAQEVEHIIPEAVIESEANGLKCIAYGNLVGLLVNAIKEQQEIINTQQKEINEIKNILKNNNLI